MDGALVLSRKRGERVKLGDNITVAVGKITGNRVRLEFYAPRDLRIVRGELVPDDSRQREPDCHEGEGGK